MPAPTMRLTLRTPDGERIQRETDAETLALAMAAYPGHALIETFDLRPQVGLVRFADGSRYGAPPAGWSGVDLRQPGTSSACPCDGLA